LKEILKKGIHREIKYDAEIRVECQASLTAVGTMASEYQDAVLLSVTGD
jgi:hypothetical protein